MLHGPTREPTFPHNAQGDSPTSCVGERKYGVPKHTYFLGRRWGVKEMFNIQMYKCNPLNKRMVTKRLGVTTVNLIGHVAHYVPTEGLARMERVHMMNT